jgi:outer membrane protein OmpA-like peptidoglycan-associated protein
MVMVIGCATGQSENAGSSSQELRSGGRGQGPGAGRFTDWTRLSKTLTSGDSVGLHQGSRRCTAVTQDREDGVKAIVFMASCLFAEGENQLGPDARPAVAAIARELKGVTDREFWIAARTPRSNDGERASRERAGALVNALIAAGVAPQRLAALLGVGGGSGTSGDAPPLPAVFAGTPILEIVAAAATPPP